ncbi:MAG: hypothetical protein VX884_04365 [Pseudomonadota bacterium]|nr:hypothetical protein [Pseudomonadota bacterium]
MATTILASSHSRVNQVYSLPVIAQLPRESAPEDIENLLSSLDRIVGVAEARVLSERELNDLVEPWLSQKVLSELASFPILVEITKHGRVDLEKNKLLTAVQEISGGTLMTLPMGEQQQPLGVFVIHWIVYFSLVGFLLLLLTTVILLVTQVSIALNCEVIGLLRLLDATELFLVQEFRLNIVRIAIIGSVIGSITAVGVMLVTLFVVTDREINELFVRSFDFFFLFIGVIALFAGPLLTWVAAPPIIKRELSTLKRLRW